MDASWPGNRTKNRIAAFDKEIKGIKKEKDIYLLYSFPGTAKCIKRCKAERVRNYLCRKVC